MANSSDEESRSHSLHIFLNSMLSSLGSVVFGQNQEGEMASKPIVPPQTRGMDLSLIWSLSLLVF